jgi:TatD DNase family protein
MYIDAHCHLDDEQFADDLDAVITRAEQAGVQAMITAGVDVESSRRVIALAEKHNRVYAVVGIHPQRADTLNNENLAAIRELASQRKVVGIGEIGLDFYWSNNPLRETQIKNFVAHLDLAAELGKPVVIHNRNADDALMEILRQRKTPRGILHCFSGDLSMAREAINLGFLISFAGNVTFKNATRLQEIARALPLEKIIIETDAPYLSPVRGKRNESANVARVAEKIAEVKNIAAAMVAQTTTQNSMRLFGLEIGEDF